MKKDGYVGNTIVFHLLIWKLYTFQEECIYKMSIAKLMASSSIQHTNVLTECMMIGLIIIKNNYIVDFSKFLWLCQKGN